MTAGLFLKNDFGAIQIDEHYPSIGLVASGNLAITKINNSNWTGTDEHGATVSITGTFPILALGGAYICGIKSTIKSGSTWTFQVCAEAAADGHTIPYYIFDNAKIVADEGCGLIVRNEDNVVVFSSSQKPMRLVDIKSGTLAAGWGDASGTYTQTWSYTSGRVYAFAPLSAAYRYYWQFIGTGAFENWIEKFYGAKRINGGIQAAKATLLSLTGSNHDSRVGNLETADYQFLIIDVTNY